MEQHRKILLLIMLIRTFISNMTSVLQKKYGTPPNIKIRVLMVINIQLLIMMFSMMMDQNMQANLR